MTTSYCCINGLAFWHFPPTFTSGLFRRHCRRLALSGHVIPILFQEQLRNSLLRKGYRMKSIRNIRMQNEENPKFRDFTRKHTLSSIIINPYHICMVLYIIIRSRDFLVHLLHRVCQKKVIELQLDREQSLGRKEGPPTTHQETKYAHFSLLSSWLRLCINITLYIQLNLSNRNRYM